MILRTCFPSSLHGSMSLIDTAQPKTRRAMAQRARSGARRHRRPPDPALRRSGDL